MVLFLVIAAALSCLRQPYQRQEDNLLAQAKAVSGRFGGSVLGQHKRTATGVGSQGRRDLREKNLSQGQSGVYCFDGGADGKKAVMIAAVPGMSKSSAVMNSF